MVRKAYTELVNWMNNVYRKPLIIYGTRQIGKTHLVVEDFAKGNFKNYIYIDLKVENDIRKFIKNHPKAKDIINYLSLRFETTIDKNTLIIFDEVEDCLPLITSLKDFYNKYTDIPIIATGSFLKMKLKLAKEGFNQLDYGGFQERYRECEVWLRS